LRRSKRTGGRRPRPYERSRCDEHGRSCSRHRGQSWSHRPESRATLEGLHAKAAPISKGNRRGQGHYRGRDSVEPRPGQSGCSSPRCLILCAVVALMCLRARGGRSSTTRWSSASVSRTITHSSAYCASPASPIASICRSLSSIALLWSGSGHPEGYPGLVCTLYALASLRALAAEVKCVRLRLLARLGVDHELA
jgi:hypothetical protein